MLKHSCSLWVGSNSFADKLINHVSASATKQRARSAACAGQCHWVGEKCSAVEVIITLTRRICESADSAPNKHSAA